MVCNQLGVATFGYGHPAARALPPNPACLVSGDFAAKLSKYSNSVKPQAVIMLLIMQRNKEMFRAIVKDSVNMGEVSRADTCHLQV